MKLTILLQCFVPSLISGEMVCSFPSLCSSLATLVLSNLQVMRCPPTMLESLIIWRQNDSFSLKHWTCQQYILGTLPTSWQYIKLSQAGYNFKSLVSLKSSCRFSLQPRRKFSGQCCKSRAYAAAEARSAAVREGVCDEGRAEKAAATGPKHPPLEELKKPDKNSRLNFLMIRH